MWRRVVGELLLLDGGSLYADVVEEEAGSDGGLRNGPEGVADVVVVACCDDVGAEAAVVELVEDCATDELAGAVGVDEIEETRGEIAAEGFGLIDVAALVLGHGEQPGVHRGGGER